MRCRTALTAGSFALLLAFAPAAAADPAPGPRPDDEPYRFKQVDLLVTAEGPHFFDGNRLEYNVTVQNRGPDTATGVVLRAMTRVCESEETLKKDCEDVVSDEEDTKSPQFFPLGALAPNGSPARFPVRLPIEDGPSHLRTTLKIVNVDQYNEGGIGECDNKHYVVASCEILTHQLS
jgi:hypothetical protein